MKEHTIKVSLANLEDTIASLLYALGAVPDNWDIVNIDLGFEVDEEGMVALDIEYVEESSTR